jgi:hypothetical protein
MRYVLFLAAAPGLMPHMVVAQFAVGGRSLLADLVRRGTVDPVR